MDRLVYTAASGAARMLELQALISNNLANVSTAGFREQLAVQRAVPVNGPPGLPTRVSTVASTPGSRMGQGTMVQTGKAADLAIVGEGWFSVQAHDGEAYTRSGEFSISAQGLLVNRQGQPVLSEEGGPIEVPVDGALTFSSDGQVLLLGTGGRANDMQPLGRLKLVNPPAADLLRGDDGLYRLPAGRAASADARVRIESGYVEQSNVSPAQALVGMIANARQFDMHMKVIQEAGANAARANSILSVV